MKIRPLYVLIAALLATGVLVDAAENQSSGRGPLAASWDEAFARMQPFHGTRQPGVDPSTLNGKVMCGYQGWFLANGDGAGAGWVHYGRGEFQPGSCTVDLWPDMTVAGPSECYTTPFHLAGGACATVFSSYNATTVSRHFQWMAQYGIDGVFLQRFGSELRTPRDYDHVNAVLDNVRHAANANGRTWTVMYDLSGLDKGEIQSRIVEDWKRLVDRMQVTHDPSYQHHGGKPVIAVWGVGFDEKRAYTLEECSALIDFLKNDPRYGGNCIMLGVPYGWQAQDRDAVKDPRLHAVIQQADIVSPWTVGRYQSTGLFQDTFQQYPGNDMAWCREHHLAYMPVIFPGLRWHNLMKLRGKEPPYGDIPREKGAFFMTQGRDLISHGAGMLYVAMFDEIDEGTAIFKCTGEPPQGASDFGTFDGLPSDAYLKMTGELASDLKNHHQ